MTGLRHVTAVAPIALALMAGALPSGAAARTTHDSQLWLNFSAQGDLGGGMIWAADVQPRLSNDLSRPSVLLSRVAIGHEVTERITIYQGFVYQELFDGQGRNERRSYQQADLDVASGRWGALKGRIRFEQRWFSNGSDMGLRFREQLRYEKPLSDRKKPLVGVLTGEVFVNMRTTNYGARRGFESTRLFGGVRIPLGEQSLETGYQAQITAPPGGDRRVDHILLMTFRLRP